MRKLLFLFVAVLLLAACTEDESSNDSANDSASQPKQLDQEELKSEEVAAEEETEEIQNDIEPIKVTMNIETIIEEDGKVHFKGETNLPDFAELMFTVSGYDYSAQTEETVLEGMFETESFSKKGEALAKGNYELSVSLSIPSTQDEQFVEVAGEDYEYLIGDLIVESVLGKTMKYQTSFKIEKEVEKEYISSDEAQEIIEYYAIGVQDKLLSVDVSNGEIKAAIEMAPNELFPAKDMVVNLYSQLSDELLNRDDWDILTIEFVGVGTISMNQSEKDSNELGDFFPVMAIEGKL